MAKYKNNDFDDSDNEERFEYRLSASDDLQNSIKAAINKKNGKNNPPKNKNGKELKLFYFKRSQKFHLINICVLVAYLGAFAIIFNFFPRPTISESEKRELAKFPKFTFESYFSGEFTKELSTFYSDSVPFREEFVTLAADMKELFGVRVDNVTFHGDVQIVNPEKPKVDITETTGNNNSQTEIIETEEIISETEITESDFDPDNIPDVGIEFEDNGIVILGDRGVMLYGGNQPAGRYYAEVMNGYKAALGEDVNVYSLVIPTAAEFYLPTKYREYSAEQKPFIEDIYAHLDGVIPIDAYSEISKHTDEDIYLKTDHHWSQLGSYYAYVAFAKVLGVEPTPIEDYEAKMKEGFVGSLYGYTSDPALLDMAEDFHYYIHPAEFKTYFYDYETLEPMGEGMLYHEYAEGGGMYSMFLGRDAIHTKIVTENKNGRKIAVIKDSFGNAFVTHLLSDFEEVYVIDARYFGTGAVDYLKSVGITDLVFANNIFFANTRSQIGLIETLMTGPVGVKPKAETVTETTVATTETTTETQSETTVEETINQDFWDDFEIVE